MISYIQVVKKRKEIYLGSTGKSSELDKADEWSSMRKGDELCFQAREWCDQLGFRKPTWPAVWQLDGSGERVDAESSWNNGLVAQISYLKEQSFTKNHQNRKESQQLQSRPPLEYRPERIYNHSQSPQKTGPINTQRRRPSRSMAKWKL